MKDKDLGVIDNLDLSSNVPINQNSSTIAHEPILNPVSCPPQSPTQQLVYVPILTSPIHIHDFKRFSQMYPRRTAIPTQEWVQNTTPCTVNESTVSSESPLDEQLSDTLESDLDLPIAVRKETRECTKKLVYPLSNYVSLNRLSSPCRNFIVSLNTIVVPNTLSEALSKEELRNAMKKEMEALEKYKTWEIVDKSRGKI